MKMTLPEVFSQRGAPMGRTTRHDHTATAPKLNLRRIKLNSGGYDVGGAYWGLGQPLYQYSEEGDCITAYVRASSREDAKAKVREVYPTARFYR